MAFLQWSIQAQSIFWKQLPGLQLWVKYFSLAPVWLGHFVELTKILDFPSHFLNFEEKNNHSATQPWAKYFTCICVTETATSWTWPKPNVQSLAFQTCVAWEGDSTATFTNKMLTEQSHHTPLNKYLLVWLWELSKEGSDS